MGAGGGGGGGYPWNSTSVKQMVDFSSGEPVRGSYTGCLQKNARRLISCKLKLTVLTRLLF